MALSLSSLSVARADTVIVYVSVDQNYAEPILDRFEAETGIRVRAVYDVEAAKTTGLINRLIAEKNRPRADVFWNGEFSQMALLKRHDVLTPHQPRGLRDVHSQDPEKLWTLFGGRARVLIVNKERLGEETWPQSLQDILDTRWPAKDVAVAYPMFGTTATQAAALFAAWGSDRALSFFSDAVDRGVRFVDGNSVVRDLAVTGDIAFGLTDTDDACAAKTKGHPVEIVFPDQGDGDMGTLVIANAVGLVRGGTNPESGAKLIDYLLSAAVADDLARAGWFHVDGTETLSANDCDLPKQVKAMDIDPAGIIAVQPDAMKALQKIVVR
ncbi:MAG: extracellular solute-binding protein [Pseudomonadota bacterium]